MLQHERCPAGEPPDPGRNPGRPPSEPGLKQILAGEDLLDEARSVSRRIWTRVWRLIRPAAPRPGGNEGPRRDEPDGRPN
jgi:hypothetical protein